MLTISVELSRYTKIMVTGPQRSGTTIASRMIALDLGYEHLPEETFHIHRLDLLCQLLLTKTRIVVQAPTMSAYCHQMPNIAVVFMRRQISEIWASERRVRWCSSDFEKAKYFDSSARSSAEVKYDMWERFQRPVLKGRAFDLCYHDLSSHHLWIPSERRGGFGRRQTEV